MRRRLLNLALVPVVVALGCGPGEAPENGEAQAPPAESSSPPGGPVAGDEGATPPGRSLPGGHPPVTTAGSGAAGEATLGGPQELTPSGEVRVLEVAELTAAVPKEWSDVPPRSSMRLAEVVLPGPGGDASMAVFRFPGGGGSREDNLTRWKTQLTPGPDTPAATTETVERDGLSITTLDARGRFSAPAMPGAPPSPDIEDARMLGLIVEGSGDPFFFKVVGDAKTIDLWAGEPWRAFVASIAVP